MTCKTTWTIKTQHLPTFTRMEDEWKSQNMIMVKMTVMLACNNGAFAVFSSTNIQVQMHNTQSAQ